jgi:hypothetical protein
MIPVIFILPFYSLESYSILKNTTSHLAAQNTPNAWIMNLVFILLGVATLIEGWAHLKSLWFHKILITIFGLSLIFTAVFQHAPIEQNIPFNIRDDELHSLFASICGWSFVTFAISCSFIEITFMRKALAIVAGVTALVLSILMFNITDYMGIWQRMIFMFSFAWSIFFFEGRKIIGNNNLPIPLMHKKSPFVTNDISSPNRLNNFASELFNKKEK